MKNPFLWITAAFVLFATLFSCKQVLDLVFPGMETNIPDVRFTIPPIPYVPDKEISLGSFTTHFNLDSTIKSNTNGVFGINSISAIKVTEVTVRLLNADEGNNLSNFKSFRLDILSDRDAIPANIVDINLPDSAFATYTQTLTDGSDLTNYLKGTDVIYNIYGEAATATTKSLNMVISIKMYVK